MTRAEQYHDCAARGLSTTETAREMGVGVTAVSSYAKRHGLVFRNARARLRRLHQDPEFAAARDERIRRRNQDPAFNPLAALTTGERADYDILKRAGHSRDEAFRAIGRADLIKGADA